MLLTRQIPNLPWFLQSPAWKPNNYPTGQRFNIIAIN
ncbi:hypothetical protein M798_13970 [Brucella melitensis ADMAS-G1]|nr:hypothetical protein M798_13970 [Brucella melitensis ADMAS-G1]